MVSKVTIVSGIFALVLLVLQVVSLATSNWFILTSSGKTVLQIGLFAICVPDKDECISYGKYIFKEDKLPFNYIAFVGLNLLGCFFNFVFIVTCITHAVTSNPRPERSFIQRQAAMWFFSAGFLLSAVIWTYASLMSLNHVGFTATTSTSVYPGYSFYLSCVTGVSYFIAAITMTVIASRLPVPRVPPNGFLVNEAPQVLVMQTDSRAYPPVGDAEHPQNATKGFPINPAHGLPQNHPSYGYNQE